MKIASQVLFLMGLFLASAYWAAAQSRVAPAGNAVIQEGGVVLPAPGLDRNIEPFRAFQRSFQFISTRLRKDSFEADYGSLDEKIKEVDALYKQGGVAAGSQEFVEGYSLLALYFFGAQESLAKDKETAIGPQIDEADKAIRKIISNFGGKVEKDKAGNDVFQPRGMSLSRPLAFSMKNQLERMRAKGLTSWASGAETEIFNELEKKVLELTTLPGGDINRAVDKKGREIIDFAKANEAQFDSISKRLGGGKTADAAAALNRLLADIRALKVLKSYGR